MCDGPQTSHHVFGATSNTHLQQKKSKLMSWKRVPCHQYACAPLQAFGGQGGLCTRAAKWQQIHHHNTFMTVLKACNRKKSQRASEPQKVDIHESPVGMTENSYTSKNCKNPLACNITKLHVPRTLEGRRINPPRTRIKNVVNLRRTISATTESLLCVREAYL